MKKLIIILMLLLFREGAFFSQTIAGLDTCGDKSSTSNIYSKKIAGDSLSTSFCILIKKEVPSHKHAFHSEHVMVLDGSGDMKLNGRSFTIKKGDLIFIPKGQTHSVRSTGKKPLKVISIQSPGFDGSDRIPVKE
jgi:mannose-6-phosphate isomerase-like protein (cupin superfamily)